MKSQIKRDILQRIHEMYDCYLANYHSKITVPDINHVDPISDTHPSIQTKISLPPWGGGWPEYISLYVFANVNFDHVNLINTAQIIFMHVQGLMQMVNLFHTISLQLHSPSLFF